MYDLKSLYGVTLEKEVKKKTGSKKEFTTYKMIACEQDRTNVDDGEIDFNIIES